MEGVKQPGKNEAWKEGSSHRRVGGREGPGQEGTSQPAGGSDLLPETLGATEYFRVGHVQIRFPFGSDKYALLK